MKTVTFFIKRNSYMIWLVGAALLGLSFPEPGSRGGILHLDQVTHIGIMLVFFLHGANLAPKNLQQGVSNWRLHLMVQFSTFALFPILGLLLLLAGKGWLPEDVMTGLFYLCALPSAITSSVAMTALARGNVPGAIFNATLSGLIGMLVTPILVSVVLKTAGVNLPLVDAVFDIMTTLLLPFIAGQLCRPFLTELLVRYKPITGFVDKCVIVLIVLSSFSDSSKADVWSSYPLASLLVMAAIVIALLVLVLTLTTWASRALGFSRADEIAAVFCGSKKSLANGMPMANIIFAGQPGLGVIVLPMMIYHQFQLLTCSVIAQRYAEAAEHDSVAELAKN